MYFMYILRFYISIYFMFFIQIVDGVYCVMFMFYGEICVFINEIIEGYSYIRNYGYSEYIMSVRYRMKIIDFILFKLG